MTIHSGPSGLARKPNAQGHDIILALDANESYNPDVTYQKWPLSLSLDSPIINRTHNGKLSTLVETCNLTDTLARQHSTQPFPASFIRGTKRIDYIFMTQGISPAILRSGCLAFHSLFQRGDHRPYYIGFDATVLFEDKIHDIEWPTGRLLCLADPRVVEKCNQLLHDKLSYYGAYATATKLRRAARDSRWHDSDTELYHTLDTIVTQSMMYAEKQVGKRQTKPYQWSPTLRKTVFQLHFWCICLKCSKGLPVAHSRLKYNMEQTALPPDSILVTDTHTIIEHICATYKLLKEQQKHHKEP
jgi:hypothetical protein